MTTAMVPQYNPWMSADAHEQRRLIQRRNRFCPRSPFLTPYFNLTVHKQAMEAAKQRRESRGNAYLLQAMEKRQAEQQKPFSLPAPDIRDALNGKEFSTNHSAVLLSPTVFVPTYYKGKHPDYISDWPCRNEMKYEGDDRISTDILHRRFPPAPRLIGNGTVNWQQRTIVQPDWLDNFNPSPLEEDILLRTHDIGQREFSELEGEVTLGKDLMKMLDPKDIW